MTHKRLVSVIMPVYRPKPEHLKESIGSILAQTYDELELLVIQDEGPEGEEEKVIQVLEEFRDDHRLRVLRSKTRRGLVPSLNEGLREASGFYIARMDSDDRSDTKRIEEQIDFMKSGGFNILGTWAYIMNEDGRILGRLKPPKLPQQIRRSALLHNPLIHSSILFKRNLVKSVGCFDERYWGSEDYEFYLRCMARGYRLANLPKFLHYLRENPLSLTRGRAWIHHRVNYLKTKFTAFFRYGYRSPLDQMYLAATPLAAFIPPTSVLTVKKALGWYEVKGEGEEGARCLASGH